MEQSSSSVRVFCRFRPTRTQHASVENELKINENTNSVILGQQAKFRANVVGGKFHFDRTFPSTATQQDVYGKVGHSLMEDTFKGYNTSIIAYGQTGSGKTHTMFGPGWDEEDTIENIVNRIDTVQKTILAMTQRTLTTSEMTRFAYLATGIRWDKAYSPNFQGGLIVSFNDLLNTHRPQDCEDDLWTIFNVVQENLIRGGINLERNGRVRRSKEVKCIHKKVTINQELWRLAQDFMVA